jgi:heme/copper-type cytochrome/quinol oxidase subunit 2
MCLVISFYIFIISFFRASRTKADENLDESEKEKFEVTAFLIVSSVVVTNFHPSHFRVLSS